MVCWDLEFLTVEIYRLSMKPALNLKVKTLNIQEVCIFGRYGHLTTFTTAEKFLRYSHKYHIYVPFTNIVKVTGSNSIIRIPSSG